MNKIKIPDQIYVTSQIVEDHIYTEVNGVYSYVNPVITKHNFGFLHPHVPGTSADASRKSTQIGWAYNNDDVYQQGNVWFRKGSCRDYDFPTRQWIYTHYDKPIDPEVAPKVWDNEPLTGFKIIDTVNRYRGNKLFKVMDPRGIEFEITAKSLFEVITDGEIKEGEILSKCVWQKGKHLIVVK